MKRFLSALLLFVVQSSPAADTDAAIASIRAVGKEGQGNEAAAAGWKSLADAPASELPKILAGMNGANPLAENWLRAAASSILDKAIISGNGISADGSIGKLAAFLRDTKNSSAARVAAFDLIQKAAPDEVEKLSLTLLNDVSSDLRRHPVGKLLEEASSQLGAGKKEDAKAAYLKALASARDEDQIKEATKKLRELGEKVDLPKHLGFLMRWKLIAPFTNVERKGFGEAFPPEKEINLTATYPGKNGAPLQWKDFESEDEYGMIDFNKPYEMLKEVTGYAFTEFHSAEERDAEIRLGCKNGWKVWLNGGLIFGRDEYHRGAKLDQYKLPCRLKKGVNTLLVKCCQNEQTEQWTVEWQFQLRVCDATGTAITEAK
jgi:hypothetical protein